MEEERDEWKIPGGLDGRRERAKMGRSMRSRVSSVFLVGCLLPGLIVSLACSNNNRDRSGPATPQSLGTQVDDVIVQVATLTGIMAVRKDTCPVDSGGPDVMTTILSGAIAGGTIQVTVESTSAFQTIIVVVQGLDGCWEIMLPQGVTIEDLLVTLDQDVDQDFVIGLQAGDTAGDFGGIDSSDVMVEPVLVSADVQVSLSFDQDTDVDLRVIEPDGTEIFYGNRTSSSGGMLDLDSNPACTIDGINQENIAWDSAPSGEYIVFVDYFEACLMDPVVFTVTIFSNGQLLGTFTDSFVQSDESFGNMPREITRFTVP